MNRALYSSIDNTEILPFIQRCMLFSDLNADQIDSVLGHTRVAELSEGDILFEQQQPARDFFMLTSGQVKLSRHSADRKSVV